MILWWCWRSHRISLILFWPDRFSLILVIVGIERTVWIGLILNWLGAWIDVNRIIIIDFLSHSKGKRG